MYTIAPVPGRLFCKPEEVSETTKSGFVLASTKTVDAPRVAIVLNVSADSAFKPGDKILYKAYLPEEVTLDKESYLVVDEVDVLGRVHEVTDEAQAKKELEKLGVRKVQI